MHPNDIIKGLRDKNLQLTMKESELVNLVNDMAEASRDYRIARATKTLALKSAGNPATLIQDLVKGDKYVAELKMKFLIAEGVLDACKKSIYNLQYNINSYINILSYEKAEYHNQQNVGR